MSAESNRGYKKEMEHILLKENIPTNLYNYDTLLFIILNAIIALENSFLKVIRCYAVL